MDFLTYSLNQNNTDYYKDIANFTNIVINKSYDYKTLDPLINRFINKSSLQKNSNQRDECLLDLLMLGTFWKVYSSNADRYSCNLSKIMILLNRFSYKNRFIKKTYQSFKPLFLKQIVKSSNTNCTLVPSIDNFRRILNWLWASGEFSIELIRLEKWFDFFIESTDFHKNIREILFFSTWFDEESNFYLGKYTSNVDFYIHDLNNSNSIKKDYIFCSRKKVEYHLNMTGAEIMNRCYRESFGKTTTKFIFVPSCLRFYNNKKCQSQWTELGNSCTGCHSQCSLYKITQLGAYYNVKTKIISHESSISSNKGILSTENGTIGVIGIACVLTLLSGGWRLKNMGIAAQCVLLDYCGCSNHWLDSDQPTNINIAQLNHLLSGTIETLDNTCTSGN
ncbi:uncharacterized protein DUF116 [Natranaerovirga pectinivora]|uniref:Uncharacterized protein DUF116 n=1 Tax=Natranaerovirga pectinivora TaxID=682400 RepID=A0A4R3MKW2_9FIRM|nr:DUF116 domain-containing protein [Natranaerovirga pectinivora]TCT14353.1 uncharacterized protein DUF116 [Natranaerovirga pectinivora]